MPLTATFDPGHNHYPNENVYFFMNDRDRRVRCGVVNLPSKSSTRSSSGVRKAGCWHSTNIGPTSKALRVRSMIGGKWSVMAAPFL